MNDAVAAGLFPSGMGHKRITVFEHNHSEWSLKGHNQNTLMPKRITVKDSALLSHSTLNSLHKYLSLSLLFFCSFIFVRTYILRNGPMHMLLIFIRSTVPWVSLWWCQSFFAAIAGCCLYYIYRPRASACLRVCVYAYEWFRFIINQTNVCRNLLCLACEIPKQL